jgi:hypothetical protein
MDYSQLLEQAFALINLGPGRDMDLRRAVSAAYYAVFHCVCTAVADQVISKSTAPELWARMYRALEHKEMANRSRDARKLNIDPRINLVADNLVNLQIARFSADYDPLYPINTQIALGHISAAQDAIEQFETAPTTAKQAYLAMLLSKQRQ